MRDLLCSPEDKREASQCPHKLAKLALVEQLKLLKVDPAVCTEWDFSKKENCNAVLAYLIEEFFANFECESALCKYQKALNGARFSSYQFWLVSLNNWIDKSRGSVILNCYEGLLETDKINSLNDGIGTADYVFWRYVALFRQAFEALHGEAPTTEVLSKALLNSERQFQKIAKVHLETLVAFANTKLGGVLCRDHLGFVTANAEMIEYDQQKKDFEVPKTGCPILFTEKRLQDFLQSSLRLMNEGANSDWRF
jgi:hypothetical protein